ncbi:DUF2508 family protein [Roseburia sp. AM51-8]|jgi:hypothetical protein|uniref:DUF2508 family protein n=1 Tax=Roseburia lenta TaxID=2763061 RepID=A0ABR7GG06_9FIRM|nr:MULTISPECIES: DUF2508 family protein [Roseburia]MBC5686217.1 DUF2508 family protein [Roseburia lenta]MDY3871783.1 DUF2508 family protein [Roseburia lenta]RHO33335.1 DUF2508 family protein [Roseburia sp. AM16-25]RHQ01145.1 DUF2508 family protein [Roseburia sp. AM51-8]
MRLLTHTKKTDPQVRLLLDDLTQTQHDLANAYSNLEYMTDPDLIDYYIYQVKAVQMRHKFLLTKVKQLNL